MTWTTDKRCGDCRFFDPPPDPPLGGALLVRVEGAIRENCRVEPPNVFIRKKQPTTLWPETDVDHPRCSYFEDANTPLNQIELPTTGGGQIFINPDFVVAVEPLSSSTTRITVVEAGSTIITLPIDEVLAALASA